MLNLISSRIYLVIRTEVVGGYWAGGAEQGSQVQSLVLRYCLAFKSRGTHPEHQLYWWLTLLLVQRGQGYLGEGHGFGCMSPAIWRSWVQSGGRRNKDQFSRFELTRGRKPVEVNSGLSA